MKNSGSIIFLLLVIFISLAFSYPTLEGFIEGYRRRRTRTSCKTNCENDNRNCLKKNPKNKKLCDRKFNECKSKCCNSCRRKCWC